MVGLAGCAVGPDYQRPTLGTPDAYKEAGDWQPAQPNDALDRGAWWSLFEDSTLDTLAQQVIVSNQNVAAAQAAYAQARASVRAQRAALFPTRSHERRVGKECVRTCRLRRSPYH